MADAELRRKVGFSLHSMYKLFDYHVRAICPVHTIAIHSSINDPCNVILLCTYQAHTSNNPGKENKDPEKSLRRLSYSNAKKASQFAQVTGIF